MLLTLVVGLIILPIGVALIIARNWIPKFIYDGLKRIYGEPYADMVRQRFGPKSVVLVGTVIMLLGAFNLVEYLWL